MAAVWIRWIAAEKNASETQRWPYCAFYCSVLFLSTFISHKNCKYKHYIFVIFLSAHTAQNKAPGIHNLMWNSSPRCMTSFPLRCVKLWFLWIGVIPGNVVELCTIWWDEFTCWAAKEETFFFKTCWSVVCLFCFSTVTSCGR